MLSNQVILVTGASQGIGEGIARRFAAEGAQVVLISRSAERLRALSSAIESEGGRALPAPCDVTREEEVARMAEEAASRFGRIDGLVNCAGVSPLAAITETSLDLWEETMGVNVTGTFLCCRAVWPFMARQGKGSILNISSGAGKQAHAGWVAYCASKWAVMGITETLSLEGFPLGIRVNALCPGPTDTPMRHRNFPGEDREDLLLPSEVADAAIFFFAEGSQQVRNASLDVRKYPRGWKST